MNKTVNYSLESGMQYKGRNGGGIQTGIEIRVGLEKDRAVLNPTNSKGASVAAWLEIPVDKLREVAKVLIDIADYANV